ncbi:BEACH domain-containing protein, partial [Lentinula edodes]
SDIAQAYESVARDVRGDVQELILEFFNCLKFLENSSNLDFGQNTGERIHDVKLPPWAKQDPWLFIIIMNHKASESLYISKNLPAWIDLIWGHNLRDPAALNVFHPLSYEGSIDLGSIMDELEREATVGIIHNFGQTPRKLFTTPHPNHYNYDVPILPIGTLHGIEDDAHPLVQVSRCFKDSGPNVPVTSLVLDMIGEKILPCPAGVLFVPWHPHELEVEWATSCTGAKEVRVVVDHKVVQVIEGSFCYSNNLVTGSSDHTVRLWTMSCAGGHLPLNVSQEHIMRAHTDEVVSVAACWAWSVIVSGSRDGSMALWNLNRAVYVQSIWHGEGG